MPFRNLLFSVAWIATGSFCLAQPTLSSPSPSRSATTSAEVAAAGKDVVHHQNNAFAKVFETVALSVVIIEISKKNDPADGPNLEDFFQGPPDETRPPPEQRARAKRGLRLHRSRRRLHLHQLPCREGQTDSSEAERWARLRSQSCRDRRERSIAVIKIDAKDLPIVRLGDSDAVRVGEFAFAIGAPFKLDYTFTYGVISGKGRSKLRPTTGYSISDYLQTDASINPGNSGGPLCDIDGAVIGMNTLINGLNRGLGFAIPVNMIKEIGGELIAGRKIVRPWLGIEIQTLSENELMRDLLKGIREGVLVGTIVADAPASKSDLHPSDVITQVDGAAVTTDAQLQHEILKKKVGQTVELTVFRKGQTLKIPVKTGELPNEVSRVANERPAPNQVKPEDIGKFGLQVQELSKEVAERLHLGVTQGVIVTDVADNSIAAEQGIERGDVITEVDNKPVTNVQSFRDALTKSDPRRGVLFYLDRKGNKTFAVLKAGKS